MRILLPSLIVVAALTLSAASVQAYGLKPGHAARAQLVFGNGWAHYDAGCARWMPFVQSWYNTCSPLFAARRASVVVAKY